MKKLSKLLAVMTAFALIIGFTSVGSVELSAASTCKASGWTKGVSQGWADEFNKYNYGYSEESSKDLYRKTTCDGNTKKVYISAEAGTEYKQYTRVEYNLKTGKRTSTTHYSGTKGSPGNVATRRTWYYSNGKIKQHNEYFNGYRDSKAGYLISKSTKYNSSGRKTTHTTYNNNGKREKHYTYTSRSGQYTRYDYSYAGKLETRTTYYKSGRTSRRKISYYNSKGKVYKANYYTKSGSSWKRTSTKHY